MESTSINVHGAKLSRRRFVMTGGALFVGIGLLGRNAFESVAEAAETTTKSNSLDAALSSSWFEIHADNTIVMRTGKVEFGQSTAHTAYKQILAEELSVPFDAITAEVMGDTDRTPDGGFSAGFLAYGGQNIPEAATSGRALLDLAADSGVDKTRLSGQDGVVSGSRQEISAASSYAGSSSN
jgi:CO/xanthine dehydrogenase Mo-binding subunit